MTGVPDSNWPPGQRRAARIVRTAQYSGGLWAGTAVLGHLPASTPYRTVLIATLAVMALIGGTVGVIGAAIHNWMIEWPAAWALAGAFLAYAILHPASSVIAAILLAGAGGYLARALELWVVSLRSRAARQERARLWRKVATETIP